MISIEKLVAATLGNGTSEALVLHRDGNLMVKDTNVGNVYHSTALKEIDGIEPLEIEVPTHVKKALVIPVEGGIEPMISEVKILQQYPTEASDQKVFHVHDRKLFSGGFKKRTTPFLGYAEGTCNFASYLDMAGVLRSLVSNLNELLPEYDDPDEGLTKEDLQYARLRIHLERAGAKNAGVSYGYMPGVEHELPGQFRNLPIDERLLDKIPEAVKWIKAYCDKTGLKPLVARPPNSTAMGFPFTHVPDLMLRSNLRMFSARLAAGGIRAVHDFRARLIEHQNCVPLSSGFSRFQTSKAFTPLYEGSKELMSREKDYLKVVAMIKHSLRVREVYGGNLATILPETYFYPYVSQIKNAPGYHHVGNDASHLCAAIERMGPDDRLYESDLTAHDKNYNPLYFGKLLESIGMYMIPSNMHDLWTDVSRDYSTWAFRTSSLSGSVVVVSLRGGIPSGALLTAIFGALTTTVSHYITMTDMGIDPIKIFTNNNNMGDDELTVCSRKYAEALNAVRTGLGLVTKAEKGATFLWRTVNTKTKTYVPSVTRTITNEVWPERPLMKGKTELARFTVGWFARDFVLNASDGVDDFKMCVKSVGGDGGVAAAVLKDIDRLMELHNRLRPDMTLERAAQLLLESPADIEAIAAEAEHSYIAQKSLDLLMAEVDVPAWNWLVEGMSKPVTNIAERQNIYAQVLAHACTL